MVVSYIWDLIVLVPNYREVIPRLQNASLIFDVGSSFNLYPFKMWVRYDEQIAAVVVK